MSTPYWQLQLPQNFLAWLLRRGRDLAHLEPIVLACTVGSTTNGHELRINVRYSMHCFTVTFDAASHRLRWQLLDLQNNPRCFNQQRYELSRLLPAMIQALPTRRVQQSHMHGQRNYVFSIPTQEQGGGVYQMFFTLKRNERAGHELDMFVESAYLAAQPSAGRGNMHFRILAGKVYKRENIRFPQRRR